jgi:two-component system chemotaxis response regulator CheY
MIEPMADSGGAMPLPAVLDLGTAAEFLAILRQRAAAGTRLRLDASAVETLTLPCIQVILAAARTPPHIVVDAPSDAFVAAFQDIGLDWRQSLLQDVAVEDGTAPMNAEPPVSSWDVAVVPTDSDPIAVVVEPTIELIEAPAVEFRSAPVDEFHAPQGGPECADIEIGEAAIDLDPSVSRGPAFEPEPVQAAAIQDPVPEPSLPIPDQPVTNVTSESTMPKKILTIDDSKTMRDMLMLTLTDAGFDVIQGVDGQDGIEVLGDNPVDVIITDINMPKMDGYGVIRVLRKSAIHKSTPILVLTTESDSDKKNLAREAGATGWMVKPFEPERLVATIRKVCP